jgi:hypothetical protein
MGSQSLMYSAGSMPLQQKSRSSSSASVVVVRSDVEEDLTERLPKVLLVSVLLLLVLLDDIEEKRRRIVFGMFRSSAAAALNVEVEADDQEVREVCEAASESKEEERLEATMTGVEDDDGEDWMSMRRVALEIMMPGTRGGAVVRAEGMCLKKLSLGEVNMVDWEVGG